MIEVVVLIADTVPTIQADSKAVRYPTVGIEVAGGKSVEARARVERRCSIGEALGVGTG